MFSKTRTIALAVAGLLVSPAAFASALTVTVDNIEKPQGSIMLAVFDEAGYETDEAFRGTSLDVEGDSVSVTFEELPAGTYGIKLYHDVNGDGEMNTNPFGMPTEPYAFSNNAKGRFGPAKWDEAQFDVSADATAHTISMK